MATDVSHVTRCSLVFLQGIMFFLQMKYCSVYETEQPCDLKLALCFTQTDCPEKLKLIQLITTDRIDLETLLSLRTFKNIGNKLHGYIPRRIGVYSPVGIHATFTVFVHYLITIVRTCRYTSFMIDSSFFRNSPLLESLSPSVREFFLLTLQTLCLEIFDTLNLCAIS